MKLLNVIFRPTGTYSDMPYRPYVGLTPTVDQKRAFARQTHDGLHLDPATLAHVSNVFIRPGKHAIKPVPIPNGWSERRLTFQFVVEHSDTMIQVITGYTDYLGVTPDGKFDPHMRLFFNRSMSFRKDELGTFEVSDACHLLLDPSGIPFDGAVRAYTRTLTPRDVLQHIGMQSLFDGMEDVIDVRPTFLGATIKKSRVSNSIPSVYLSRLTKAYQDLERDEEEHNYLMEVAAGMVTEPLFINDSFLRMVAQNSDIMMTGSVAYRDFIKLPVEGCQEEHVKFVSTKTDMHHMFHEKGDTAEWSGGEPSVQTATLLGNTVPALMAEHQISDVHFSAVRNEVDNTYQLAITGAACWSTKAGTLEAFKRDLRQVALPHLTYLNGRPQKISVAGGFSLAGESHMQITIDNRNSIPFCMPTFADARFAPVLSGLESALNSLALHLGKHLDFITGVTGENQ
jgi:hypothetical protein